MIVGIGIYASLASMLASYFIRLKQQTDIEKKLSLIEKRLNEISKALELLKTSKNKKE